MPLNPMHNVLFGERRIVDLVVSPGNKFLLSLVPLRVAYSVHPPVVKNNKQ